MSEPFLGEVRLFGFTFAPRGWANCDGQLLPISQNNALFALLGTTYGGDGQTTFGLPDLRGRYPMHTGQGPGLSSRPMGQEGGQELVTLTTNEMPGHGHVTVLKARDANATSTDPANAGLSVAREDTYGTVGDLVDMEAGSVDVGNTGGSQPHNNMPPFLAMRWCIALVGIFPSQ